VGWAEDAYTVGTLRVPVSAAMPLALSRTDTQASETVPSRWSYHSQEFAGVRRHPLCVAPDLARTLQGPAAPLREWGVSVIRSIVIHPGANRRAE
jgi:hypothetical protein